MAVPDYYFGPKADVFDPIAALIKLATGVDSFFLENSTNRKPTHYGWQPLEGSFASNRLAGQGPRVLADVEWGVSVLCRGPTHDEAWRMAQVFASAARRVKAAAFKLISWSVAPSSSQPATLKTDVILTCSFTMPFLEQRLETEGQEGTEILHVAFDLTSPPYGTNDGTLIAPLG